MQENTYHRVLRIWTLHEVFISCQHSHLIPSGTQQKNFVFLMFYVSIKWEHCLEMGLGKLLRISILPL